MGTDEGIIGREHPSSVVRADIARLVDSHGGVLLVTGEAGIGKTTLVSDAAEHARRVGVLVLGGSCWDSASAPGYWPWVQVIRALRRAVPTAEWAEITATVGQSLSTLLGEGAPLSSTSNPGPSIWPDGAPRPEEEPDAFRLADAVTSALVIASQTRPVMVVLDDLHWADPASLQLLEFAGQHTWFERLLLAGTYRDAEVDAVDSGVRPLLAPVVAKATTVTLTGLDRAEVAALIARVAGRAPEPDVVDEVHRRTGGNPFFVEQTARLWQVEGTLRSVPPGVRDAVRRRVALLPADVVRVLMTGAVLGQDFSPDLLAASAGMDQARVSEALAVAVTARLVQVKGEGRYGFAHDLVRETLYNGLDEDDRRRRHAAVVAAARAAQAGPSLLPADLARHAFAAGDRIPAALAVDLLVAAASDAGARLSSAEAIGHYRRALDRVDDPVRRVRITLDLGHELDHAGDRSQARRHLNEAASAAMELGDPLLLARVALTAYRHRATSARAAEAGAYDADHLLREAHRQLAGEVAADAPIEHILRELVARTELLARRDADDDALTFSLWARHDAIWGLGTAKERLSLTSEMRQVAQRTGDNDSLIFAMSLTWVALLELGDPGYMDQLNEFVAAAAQFDIPRYDLPTVVDRSIIAAFRGDFEESGRLLADFLTFDHGTSEFGYMAQHLRWALHLLRGELDEADDLLASLTETQHPYLDLATAITAVERGDIARASRHTARVRVAAPTYPRYLTPLWLRLQAQMAAATGDADWAERVRQELDPHRGEWLVSIFGCDISGPVEHWLAVMDVALGRWDRAAQEAATAVDAAERMGARPWAAMARAVLARALAGAGDPARAGRPPTTPATRPDGAAPAQDGATPEFRRDGAVWRLAFAGQAVHVPDAKGLRDLHALLSQPYVDIPAVQLLDPAAGPELSVARSLAGDPVLDDEARTRYRARLADLDAELDRAGRRGDAERGAALEQEREALLAELRRAIGLGGRARRLGDEAERARKAVTNRIRDTLRKLSERHPALAEHLRETVSTGSTCRYAPAEAVRWRL
jgi:hypothetical protein